MLFPSLYKRAANGAIRKWTIEVVGNSYYRKSGQLGGAFIQVDDLDIKGKVNRTDEEQAESEAKSYWKKQLDHGYKTLQQLGIECEDDLERALPKFNTDAQGMIKPMLAKAVNWDKIKYPVMLQPKLDGVRCLMKISKGEVSFTSRSGKIYTTLSHIENDVLKVIENTDNYILDGEVYSDEISFQEIISAVKAQGPNSIKLKFRAYDTVSDQTQADRIAWVIGAVMFLKSRYIVFVDTHVVHNKEEVMGYHDNWIKEGNEGAMIRFLDGKYKQGIRSSELLKVKVFNEEDFDCIGMEHGKREEDVIAICTTEEGKIFRAKMMGSREYKENMVEEFIEGKLSVKFFGWTDDNIPRFPIGKILRNYE